MVLAYFSGIISQLQALNSSKLEPILSITVCSFSVFSYHSRKTDISGSSNIVDTLPSSKAYELIAELCLKEEQLRDNGYPRAGEKPGTAIICKAQSAVPNNERDRYCRRCGKTFTLDQYDEECIDQCNYHPKSPGFRRGNYSTIFASFIELCGYLSK